MVPTVAAAPAVARLTTFPSAEELTAGISTQRRPFFLDSGIKDAVLGRFSFLGCDPYLVMGWRDGLTTILDSSGRRCRLGDPLATLEALLAEYSMPDTGLPVPFSGGAVGYLGYDLGRVIERIPSTAAAGPADIPDLYMALYDAVIAYDHTAGEAYLISSGLPEPAGTARVQRAHRRLAWLESLVHSSDGVFLPPSPPTRSSAQQLTSNFSRESYLAAVDRARRYIIAGDIYQVNLSQQFRGAWPGHPWELYSALRTSNPAPFAAYLDLGEVTVISSSPERFLRFSGGVLETRPIKGTRPRGRTVAEDTSLACQLKASGKDRAEHIMIVDLERNDLGRISRVGTVQVPELMALESYATVHHLTSTVKGLRRDGSGISDILKATFPGGSITGAPKIRAMEIIEELEPTRRGIYTGAIGYFSASGSFDLNIAIRTIVLQRGVATFQVGGGIVYDSDPAEEYQETLDKGRALAAALGAR